MAAPKNLDDFLDLVDQALFEVEDLVASAAQEGEDDELSRYLPVYQGLIDGLQALKAQVQAGALRTAMDADLPFYALALRYRSRLPFFAVIEIINRTYRRGWVDVG